MRNWALIMVDVQNDFCPGGSLAITDGDQVVHPLNLISAAAAMRNCPILASRDWHPRVTKHFQTYGGIWPVHCVQGTFGAEFHKELNVKRGIVNATVVSKGMDPNKDDYSAFDGIAEDGRNVFRCLWYAGVETVLIGGLATDYCVKATALDARKNGFRVVLLTDACRAVNLQPDDGQKAIEEMAAAGVKFKTVKEVQDELDHQLAS